MREVGGSSPSSPIPKTKAPHDFPLRGLFLPKITVTQTVTKFNGHRRDAATPPASEPDKPRSPVPAVETTFTSSYIALPTRVGLRRMFSEVPSPTSPHQLSPQQ